MSKVGHTVTAPGRDTAAMPKLSTWRKAEDDRAALQEERDRSDRAWIARVLAKTSIQGLPVEDRLPPLPAPRRGRR